MEPILVKKIIYPLICYRRRNKALSYLKEYENSQWLSKKALEEYQMQQLSRLLRFAYDNVSFYRSRFDEIGLLPEDIKTQADILRLPMLTKDSLRERFVQLKSNDLGKRKWYLNRSGGSTGKPVTFIQDRDYKEKSEARSILVNMMVGKDIGDREVLLWGSERDLFQGTIGFRNKLTNFIFNRKFLNSFKMSQNNMREYIKQINTMRPQLVRAYAQSVYELARFSLERSLPIDGVKSVMTEAGTLYPFMRETISEVFAAPVFNRYASREVGDIAAECNAHLGLHINMETHYIEIIDELGNLCQPGQEGEIIITLLTNYAMPLIRYRIGDMGVWAAQECSCGRGSRLLKTVTGRTTDYFISQEGRIIPSEYFIHLLGVVLNSGWVKKTQIIQEYYNYIIVKFAVYTFPSDKELNDIIHKIRLVMGESCRVEFQFVDDIPSCDSGKYRYTISKVHKINESNMFDVKLN